jgi:hypothetical protein
VGKDSSTDTWAVAMRPALGHRFTAASPMKPDSRLPKAVPRLKAATMRAAARSAKPSNWR